MKKKTPVAAGYVFQMCKQALKFCRVRRYAVSTALEDLTIPDVGKKQAKKDRVLNDKEAGDLWAAISSGTCFMPYYTRLLTILMVFGCRTQEARLSEWSEWDMDAWSGQFPKSTARAARRL
jgi:integrase